jgi:excisionase family DNA binding protein
MQSALSSPKLISVREAAELLGCSTWTIRRWISDGAIHAVRPTPKANYRVPLTDLEAFFAAGRDTSRAVDSDGAPDTGLDGNLPTPGVVRERPLWEARERALNFHHSLPKQLRFVSGQPSQNFWSSG